MNLKNSSIGIGGTPAPIGKYGQTPRPAKTAAPTETPRDNGGLSTGTTSGNFSLAGMANVPNNSGATGTQAGVDAAIAAQESNKQL